MKGINSYFCRTLLGYLELFIIFIVLGYLVLYCRIVGYLRVCESTTPSCENVTLILDYVLGITKSRFELMMHRGLPLKHRMSFLSAYSRPLDF